MDFLIWLEATALSVWVGESLWGYPLMLNLHVAGLAMAAGMMLVLGLRLLGLFPNMRLHACRRCLRIFWAGFAINALSGTALFASQATIFVTSVPFLIKLSCVLAGVAVAVYLQAGLGRDAGLTASLRLAGALTLCLWVAAVSAGRLIAYF